MSALIEPLRRAVRAAAPLSLYRRGSSCLDAFEVIRREGWTAWRTLNLRVGAPREVRLTNLAAPLQFRPGTDDRTAIIQNIVREEYGARPLVGKPRWMIDAGAYIGDVSCYFASRFPELNVVALEPNPEAFPLLQTNASRYGGRIRTAPVALWSESRRLNLSGREMGAAVAPVEAASGGVQGVTLPALLDEHGIDTLDILKVDIEGAEGPVFAAAEAWLPRVRLIIIEVHGDALRRQLQAVFAASGFRIEAYRSVWYVRRPEGLRHA